MAADSKAPPSTQTLGRRAKLVVSLIVVTLFAIAVIIVLPNLPWSTSGEIHVPVRIFVFDATRRLPIAAAKVAVFRSPPVLGPNSLAADDRDYRPNPAAPIADTVRSTTGADGMAVIEFDFKTSANNRRPQAQAHTRWVWLEIYAEGYGTVVIPVRHDSTPIAELRKQGELLVPVGLVAAN